MTSSKAKPRLFLADLTHDTHAISNDMFPIAIGYIAAYIEKMLPGKFDIQLFRYPDHLLDTLDENPPDIMAMSYWPWNMKLTMFAGEHYKKVHPDGILALGANSVPVHNKRQKEFHDKFPIVDLQIMWDGEFGMVEALKRYLEMDGDRAKMLSEQAIDGCGYWDEDAQIMRTGGVVDRPKEVDIIPSPYLEGWMDPFFDDMRMIPLVQTTRGCPFKCAFCFAGTDYIGQTKHFSIERIQGELEYIAERRAGTESGIFFFADSNFGMYKKDEEIGTIIAGLQEKYGFPTSFSTPCGKENKDRMVKIAKQIKNIYLTVSVQSTDAGIQKNNTRKPIKVDQYRDIVQSFKQLGIPVATEIITGLPGETRETHLRTIQDLMYMGIDEVHAFTLMMLEGIPINDEDSQEKYEWDRRYRVMPRGFGTYRGHNIFELDEVAVGSNTFSYEDYLYLRGFHGALRITCNSDFFGEFVDYLRQKEVNIFDFSLRFYESVRKDDGAVGDLFKQFLHEANYEVWSTVEELEETLADPENFQKLATGEIGENLMEKYKFLSTFRHFDEICTLIYQKCVEELKAVNAYDDDAASELMDIYTHTMAKASGVFGEANMRGEAVIVEMTHDVPAWRASRGDALSNYRFPEAKALTYVIEERNRPIVNEIINVHSKSERSLSRAIGNRYYLPAVFRIGHVSEDAKIAS